MNSTSANQPQWLPLESNPQILNEYIQSLGIPENKLTFSDVWGTDQDSLDMVPKPVIALLFLSPNTNEEEIQDETADTHSHVWFVPQTISNACGTIAVLHALANNEELLCLKDDSPLFQFLDDSRGMYPDERARLLEQDTRISGAHLSSANVGQTSVPDPEEVTPLHFITFVEKDGDLFELDGRRGKALRIGPTTPETFLKDATAICKEKIERNPTGSHNFSLIALSVLPE